MSKELTVLEKEWEKNYNKGLKYGVLCKRISYASLPLNVGLLVAGFTPWVNVGQAFGCVMVGVVVGLINAGLLEDSSQKKESYYPNYQIGDLVYYNPKDKDGNRAYHLSKEHPVLNQKIPVWKIISIGATSLVIENVEGVAHEISFYDQADLLTLAHTAQAQIEIKTEPLTLLPEPKAVLKQ